MIGSAIGGLFRQAPEQAAAPNNIESVVVDADGRASVEKMAGGTAPVGAPSPNVPVGTQGLPPTDMALSQKAAGMIDPKAPGAQPRKAPTRYKYDPNTGKFKKAVQL
jgi:hypothetical protein